jgi:hypothetical protein
MNDQSPIYHGKSIQSALERQLIGEFLRRQGYSKEKLQVLPENKKRELLKAASQYASLKLAEIESCSQFIHKLHTFTLRL